MGWKEQEFTAPGTWTNPGSVTSVRVLVVGGAGGGKPSPIINWFSGGSGAVLERVVQVSGPQPVVVGAGGNNGDTTPTSTVGGDSTFGAPGPTQVVAGGGGAGGAVPGVYDAPPVGGGGGAPYGLGVYGYPAGAYFGGGMAGIGGTQMEDLSGTGGATITGFAWRGDDRFLAGSYGPGTSMREGEFPGGSATGSATGPGTTNPGLVVVKWFE